MSIAPLDPTQADLRSRLIDELRDKVDALQSSPTGEGGLSDPVPTHPAIANLLTLRAGQAYAAGSASAALVLAAGPSMAGGWTAVIGMGDLGVEAAGAYGLELTRCIAVPEPGERWLEVVAALADVVGVVLVRPPVDVGAKDAARIAARLRKGGSVLIARGSWPRAAAQVNIDQDAWTGLDRGHGRLRARRSTISVRRGLNPPRTSDLWLPDEEHGIRVAQAVPATPVREVVRSAVHLVSSEAS